MRKLLNTLYITTPNSYISKDGLNVVISVEGSEVFRIPAINIEGIVTFGYMGVSPGLMRLCVENGNSISFLSPSGKFVSRVVGPKMGNVLLRKKQCQLTDDDQFAVHLCKLFIMGKIQNYRSILQRYLRDYGQNESVAAIASDLKRSIFKVSNSNTIDSIRGIEGDAAKNYFSVFPNLITQQKDFFTFHGRTKHPPKDCVNALLSFAYTLIAHEMASALESVGLDPYIGFLHTLRPGRCSLALDMMEELRAYMGDRFVLSLINRRQLSPNDFKCHENSVILNENGRKKFITAWQARKQETLEHPYLKEKIKVGLIPYVQATLLARYFRKEIDDYPVFIIK